MNGKCQIISQEINHLLRNNYDYYQCVWQREKRIFRDTFYELFSYVFLQSFSLVLFFSLSLFFFYLFPVRELYFIVHRHGLEGMDYSERKQAYRVSLPGRHLAFFRVFLDFVYASSQTSRFAVKHCKYCDLTRVYQAGHVLQSIVDDDLFFINITSPYLSLSCLYILCTCNKFT